MRTVQLCPKANTIRNKPEQEQKKLKPYPHPEPPPNAARKQKQAPTHPSSTQPPHPPYPADTSAAKTAWYVKPQQSRSGHRTSAGSGNLPYSRPHHHHAAAKRTSDYASANNPANRQPHKTRLADRDQAKAPELPATPGRSTQ